MAYHAENPRYSQSSAHNSGGSNGSQTTPTTLSPTGRRGSIFDLMFLLRRSSGSRSKLQFPQKQSPLKVGEGEAFLHQQHHEGTEEEEKEMSRDQLLAKIREKKEVIEKLRCQPWPMRRKRRTLKLAQKYLQKHESKVSKTHLYKEAIMRKWKKFERWWANVSVYLIPWEMKIKAIESQFGTVVSSYFTFLRWILWVNVSITVMMLTFIVIPEVLADKLTDRVNDPNKTEIYKERKTIIGDEKLFDADRLQVLWDYGGFIAKSPLFYGYYSNEKYLLREFNYPLPLIYFLVNLVVLGYSFFAILRKMASNARSNRMTSGKTDQYPFVWKISAGWDFSIGVSETATNAAMANVMKFREAINGYKEKQKEKFILVLFLRRVLANIIILCMIAFSTWLIYNRVDASKLIEVDIHATTLQKNEVPIVVSVITLVFPNIFELIGILLERFHPRIALRLQLGRILVLYLLNFFTLIVALIAKTKCSDPLMCNNSTDNSNTGVGNAQASAFVGDPSSPWNANNNYSNFDDNVTMFSLNTENYMEILNNLTLLTSPITLNRTLMETTLLGAGGIALPLAAGPVSLFHLIKNYFLNNTKSNANGGNKRNVSVILKRFRRQRQDGSSYYAYSTDNMNPTTTASPDGVQATTYLNGDLLAIEKAKANFRPNVSQDELQNGPVKSWPLHTTTPPHPTTVELNVSDFAPFLLFAPYVKDVFDRFEPYFPPVTFNYSEVYPTTSSHGTDGDVVQPGVEGGDTNEKDHQKAESEKQKGTPKRTDSDRECWENAIGQEMCKLITMDLVMSIASILFVDFFRGIWVRYCSRWWCWPLETFFPEYGEFKVAENVLHLINNQGMVWLGLFFTPLLPAINNVKIIILLYVRAWALVTCNVPATQVFRASRSSNFYLLLCLLMLFLCTVPVGIVIASMTPSKSCGPFGSQERFYSVISQHLPAEVSGKLDTVASPGVVVPMLILLVLIIYFLISLVRGLKEANEDLQGQLILERTEEKRKIYKMAGKKDRPDRGSMALPETRKIDRSHLPAKEQIRREPWHPKLILNDAATDSSRSRHEDDSVTPSMEGYSPASPSRHHMPEINPSPYYPSHVGASPVGLFVPSLTCLPEENRSTSSAGKDSEDDELDTATKGKPEKEAVKVTVAPPKASMEDLTTRTTTPATTSRIVANNEAAPLHAPKSNNLNNIEPSPPADNVYSNLRPFPSSPFYDAQFLSPTTALTTPNSESWPLSAYDNDTVQNTNTLPTPSPTSMSVGFDLSPGMLAEMLSPTKFSPNTFEEFLRHPFRRNGKPLTTAVRSKSPDVLVHVSGTDTDHEKHPSDSGRATMDSAMPGTTETDTGTESELERFAKSRLRSNGNGNNQKSAAFAPIKIPTTTTEEEEEDDDVPDSRPLMPRPHLPSSSRKFEPLPSKLPDTKTVIRPMYTSFVPWPVPADEVKPSSSIDGRPPKPILKHVGPPGRGNKTPSAPDISDRQSDDSPVKRPKFKISVSPSRGRASSSSSPDSSIDRKPYIIRQTISRTPSPVGSPSYSSVIPPVMSSSATASFPTKLSVIDEGIISKPLPAPRHRTGSSGLLTDSSVENLSNVLYDPLVSDLERLSRPIARRHNNNNNGSDQQQSAKNPAHHKSKETMI